MELKQDFYMLSASVRLTGLGGPVDRTRTECYVLFQGCPIDQIRCSVDWTIAEQRVPSFGLTCKQLQIQFQIILDNQNSK